MDAPPLDPATTPSPRRRAGTVVGTPSDAAAAAVGGGDFAIPFARPRGPMPQAWVRSTTTGAAVPVEVSGTRPLRVCRPNSLVL